MIDPQSVLAGWTGVGTAVVVRVANAGGGDTLTVRNAANSAQLPLGSTDLGGTGYLTVTAGLRCHRDAVDDAPEGLVDHDHARNGFRGDDNAGGNDDDGLDASGCRTDRAGNTCLTTVVNEALPATSSSDRARAAARRDRRSSVT